MDFGELADGVSADLQKVLPIPQQLPRLSYREGNSFHTAPGFREMGMYYSCVPDAVYPWDPVVMKQIREFAPDAVPLWVTWVFMSPSDTGNPEVTIFGRHALGRALAHPGYEVAPFRCLMPTMPCQGLTFERPNRIWFVHEGERDMEGKYKDLPGRFLGFDDSILRRAKDAAIGFNMTQKEFVEFMKNEYIEKKRIERDRRKAALAAEMAERDADMEKYTQAQLEKLSDVEIEQFLKSAGKRQRVRKPSVIVP